jgi:hypothetical protein
MAVVKGVKEQVHLPLYDCVEVKPGKQLGEILTSNVLRFFVDVNRKTKLLTNMQAASLLPHWNTFEARALRVVISDLCPQFNDEKRKVKFQVVDENGDPLSTPKEVELDNFTLATLVDFRRRVEDSERGPFFLTRDELLDLGLRDNPELEDDEFIFIDRAALTAAAQVFGDSLIPPKAQIFPNNGCGTVIGSFIYNTVTSFFVGEKIMIQVPTWFFPAGAGPYSEDGGTITHGYPNPQATFRFAEPVSIETQQNFRVEIEVPESDVLKDFQRLYGPLFIWVVLDGYMTRDVQ